jgi:hypothetical protein
VSPETPAPITATDGRRESSADPAAQARRAGPRRSSCEWRWSPLVKLSSKVCLDAGYPPNLRLVKCLSK